METKRQLLMLAAGVLCGGLMGCEALSPEQKAAFARSAGRALDAAAQRLISDIAGKHGSVEAGK